jgi:hypothetical protein
MTPTSGTIDKASKITISLKLTEPILCNDPHAYCGVTVLFTNANPKQITLSACHVEWVRDAWTETKTGRSLRFTRLAVIDLLMI